MPYQSRQAGSIADLMLRGGDIRARQAEANGQAWGQTIQGLGHMAATTIGDIGQYKADAPVRAERLAELADVQRNRQNRDAEQAALKANVDPVTGRVNAPAAAKAITQIDPERAREWWQQADAEKQDQIAKDKEKATHISQWAGALRSVPADQRPTLYATGRADLIKGGMATAAQIPETYDEGWVVKTHTQALTIKEQIEALEKAQPKPPGTREIKTRNADGTETVQIVPDVAGKTFQSAAAPDKPDDKERAYRDYARDVLKRPYETMTFADKRRADGAIAAATRAPDKPDKMRESDYISNADRAAADKYKFEQLQKLENERAATAAVSDPALVAKLPPEAMAMYMVFTGGKTKRPPMTDAELGKRKLDIENLYRRTIGMPALETLPPEWNAKTPAPAAAVVPTPAVTKAPATAVPTPKIVTQAELAVIAQRRGTTVDQEAKRAAAAGYSVR